MSEVDVSELCLQCTHPLHVTVVERADDPRRGNFFCPNRNCNRYGLLTAVYLQKEVARVKGA